MTLEYFDKNDVATATVTTVRAIKLTLKGVTDERVYKSGGQSSAVETPEHVGPGSAQERAPAVNPTPTQEISMRTPRLADERGMALAVAIFALVVVGALVAGAFFAGNLEQRTGRNAVYASEAADAAESGISSVFGAWDVALNGLAVGDSLSESATSLGARINVSPKVIRLNNELFRVRSLGQRTDPSGKVLAQRTVATVARLVTVTTSPSRRRSRSTSPSRSTEPRSTSSATTPRPPGGPVAARPGPGGHPERHHHRRGRQGHHPPLRQSQAGRQRPDGHQRHVHPLFGDKSFDELKASANIVLPSSSPYNQVAPSLTGNPQKCNTGDEMNWGEPWRSGGGDVSQCTGYFPIIYGSGSQLKLTGGGRGQGLLLVEGDFVVAGGFEFTGLIIAQGRHQGERQRQQDHRRAAGPGRGHRRPEQHQPDTTLQYSSCAISQGAGGLRPRPSR